jgi:ABC-type Na+ transport system ATPase subunit NatA
LDVEGKLSPFIVLGVGFNLDLTARENVLINAIMLGLSRREARERFGEIVAFAGLEEFLDLKLKNYSSGMQVRLAFSVATQVDADVLLIDEVLAVGDAAFQRKCFDQFDRLKAAGTTIVLVTHDMHAVERFCDRAMVLERGRIVDIGDPHHVAHTYNEINFGRYAMDAPQAEREGDRVEAEITGAWVEDAAGERVPEVAQGEPARFVMEVRFRAPLDEPVFGFTLRHEAGHIVFATRTDVQGVPTGRFEGGDAVTVNVTFDNHLAPGVYRLTPSLARAGATTDALDARMDLVAVTVTGPRPSEGLVDLPHAFAVERR